ncbi:hypothetical protein [Zestomonas thermotolerans]|uniref:hypothetical protein n=1 Tax=Zestomonas thermotolerans TaxID=157784 RepID=UPI0003809BA9
MRIRIKATTTSSTPKPPPATSSHEALAAQVAAFLKAGGEIQEIPRGVSGQNLTPKRHISLGKK